MNPILSAICQKEQLPLNEITPLSGGQINLVFQAGPECVLRVARTPEASHRLLVEARVLQSLENTLPVPKILAAGEVDGLAYQVQRRLPGDKLHRRWPELAAAQKESIIAQLGQHLDTLHRLPLPSTTPGELVGAQSWGLLHNSAGSPTTWTDFCQAWLDTSQRALSKLPADAITQRVLELVNEAFTRNLPYLAASQAALVHADLWPGNILVEAGAVTGILDFEFAHAAPRDYELLLIEDFCLYPNDFVEEDFEHVCAADYADFFRLLQEHTPGLFSIPHLRERLDLYHLLFNLQRFAAFRRAGASGAVLAKLARITNILFGHGVRMFM